MRPPVRNSNGPPEAPPDDNHFDELPLLGSQSKSKAFPEFSRRSFGRASAARANLCTLSPQRSQTSELTHFRPCTLWPSHIGCPSWAVPFWLAHTVSQPVSHTDADGTRLRAQSAPPTISGRPFFPTHLWPKYRSAANREASDRLPESCHRPAVLSTATQTPTECRQPSESLQTVFRQSSATGGTLARAKLAAQTRPSTLSPQFAGQILIDELETYTNGPAAKCAWETLAARASVSASV